VKSVVRGVLDLLAQPTCASCGVGVPGDEAGRLCVACRAEIRPLRIPDLGLAGVTQVLCVAPFDGLLQLLIQRFKYGGELPLARPLAELLVEHALSRDLEPDLVVPMPLHPARQRARGFDHGFLLAGPVAEALGAPRVVALERREERLPQVGLPLEERHENVTGVFSPVAGVDVTGRQILLIDDVVTTGATAQEAARVLRGAGASSVDVLALGRTP
jgi:ComF family protein